MLSNDFFRCRVLCWFRRMCMCGSVSAAEKLRCFAARIGERKDVRGNRTLLRMRFAYNNKTATLTVYPEGEIDQYYAGEMRSLIDNEINKRGTVSMLVLDFKNVTFMDSAGIGMILGRYKLLRLKGATLVLRNVSAAAERVLRIAGVYKLLEKNNG